MSRDSYLRRAYGISGTEYDAMWIQQGGVCAICKRPPRNGENLCVDHSQQTGGLRCFLVQPGLAEEKQISLFEAMDSISRATEECYESFFDPATNGWNVDTEEL